MEICFFLLNNRVAASPLLITIKLKFMQCTETTMEHMHIMQVWEKMAERGFIKIIFFFLQMTTQQKRFKSHAESRDRQRCRGR